MLVSIIMLIVSLLLDGILSNYLPFLVNDLSLFTPLLTLVSIFIIYPFFKKKEIPYFIIVFVTGMIYDLFYTNLLFFNAVLFLSISLITIYIYKNLEVNSTKLIIYLIIIVAAYESLTGIILFIYNVVPVTIPKVLYKITHSLILNIIYGELLYGIIKVLPKKYKKISIN